MYKVIPKYPNYPKTKKKKRRKTKREEGRRAFLHELELLRIRELPWEEKLSFFISSKEALRELNAAMDFVQGLKLPEIRALGKFRYSLDSDLSANIVRAYTDSELNLGLTENLISTTINYKEPDQEPDLISFRLSMTDRPKLLLEKTVCC